LDTGYANFLIENFNYILTLIAGKQMKFIITITKII